MQRSALSTQSIIGDLSPEQLAHLRAIGNALFKGVPLRVSQDGLVYPKPQLSSEKDEDYGQSEGTHGSSAGPREGRQGAPGRPRYPDHSDLLRWCVSEDQQCRRLKEAYSGTKWWPDRQGTWLVVRSYPIGRCGPQALILILVPPIGPVSAWAFWYVPGNAIWIGPRHTNLGDASVCAFPPEENHLECAFPLTRYVDLLSEWCARHLYYAVHEKWPGPQEGRWRYYRRMETRPGECCPRCGGLSFYEDCCKILDEAEASPEDRLGFQRATGVQDVALQHPPPRVISLAMRGGRRLA